MTQTQPLRRQTSFKTAVPVPRPTVTLRTRDGRHVKRYLDNLSEAAPLTLEESCGEAGVDYAELMAKEIADRERFSSDEHDRTYTGFYAFEQMGQNVYDDPRCESHHEIKGLAGLWLGRTVFVAGMAMLVKSRASAKSARLMSAGGTMASVSYEDRYGKWIATCFGDVRVLAKADFV